MGTNLIDIFVALLSQPMAKKEYLNLGYLQIRVNRLIIKITDITVIAGTYCVTGTIIGKLNVSGKHVYYDAPKELILHINDENCHHYEHTADMPTSYLQGSLRLLEHVRGGDPIDVVNDAVNNMQLIGLYNPATQELLECLIIPASGYDHTRMDGVSKHLYYDLQFLCRTANSVYSLPGLKLTYAELISYLHNYLIVPKLIATTGDARLYADVPEWAYLGNM